MYIFQCYFPLKQCYIGILYLRNVELNTFLCFPCVFLSIQSLISHCDQSERGECIWLYVEGLLYLIKFNILKSERMDLESLSGEKGVID